MLTDSFQEYGKSLLDIAERHRTATHLYYTEVTTLIGKKIKPGMVVRLGNSLSDQDRSKVYTYEIEKQLGSGAFGIVYKGVATWVDATEEEREVAIKIEPYLTLAPCISPMKNFVDDKYLNGFVKVFAAGEITSLRDNEKIDNQPEIQLSKGSILNLYSFLGFFPTIREKYQVPLGCMVMEYVRGNSLQSIMMAAQASLSKQENQQANYLLRLLQIMIDASVALEGLHQKGTLHGDLHPRNILVTDKGVKIIDFSCVKKFGEPAGRVSQHPFTPTNYARNIDKTRHDYGAEAYIDIYPLAFTLYGALVNSPSFKKGNTFRNLEQISHLGLRTVIRSVLQKEHPELNISRGQNSEIQTSKELALALIKIFSEEYSAWIEIEDNKITTERDVGEKKIRGMEEKLERERNEDAVRWEDFSIWWAQEIEKEHAIREQWTDVELQWFQQQIYDEALKQKTNETRMSMTPTLNNELDLIGNKWHHNIETAEKERSKTFHDNKESIINAHASYEETFRNKKGLIVYNETERWNAWKKKPVKVFFEGIAYGYGTTILKTQEVYKRSPFFRLIRETIGELRKVSWPTFEQAQNEVYIVLISSTVVGSVGVIINMIFSYLWRLWLGK